MQVADIALMLGELVYVERELDVMYPQGDKPTVFTLTTLDGERFEISVKGL